MCNPRRVHVTATREVTEAWEHEITRIVALHGNAVGEARIQEPLDSSIGGPTLAMLEQVLASAEGWQTVDGGFRYELDGGYVMYHPDSQELEIVAQVTDVVDVQASASQTASGAVNTMIEARGTGTYYDDEWGGITEEDARRAADDDAHRNLEVRRRELLEAQRSAAEDELAADLDAVAATRAEAELVRRTQARSEQLDVDATTRLTAVGIQGRNAFHRVLAAAYLRAIEAYARSRGAEGWSATEHEGVLDIEFVMQA